MCAVMAKRYVCIAWPMMKQYMIPVHFSKCTKYYFSFVFLFDK